MKISIYVLCLCFSAIAFAAEKENTPDAANFEIKTTQDLLRACSWPEEDALHARAISFCYGYLLSAVHYDAALHHNNKKNRIVCPDETTSLKQVVETFVGWAEKHPQYMGELPVEGVMRAANSRWPCSE